MLVMTGCGTLENIEISKLKLEGAKGSLFLKKTPDIQVVQTIDCPLANKT